MANLPVRFTQIDETNRGDHPHFRDGDQWAFLFEKTSGRDFSFSETNNLISNLKKPVNASQAQLNYKAGAIRRCAASLRQAINDEWLDGGTLVPIPPSKVLSDPLYDNRMEQICNLIRPNNVDVRNLVVQNQSMIASHERPPGTRITIDELVASYSIDESLAEPHPSAIAVVDDMLTAGTHYRSMHTVLSQRFPQAYICGLFIARRVFPDEDEF
ncbi:MAG: hypothetical protein ABJH07_07020 [Sedimentitalea sp.]|uniref:hypothetical protein n=1 Tax=Sedimentitalea sp. TaxID=2048915 RepID=UPI003264A0B4